MKQKIIFSLIFSSVVFFSLFPLDAAQAIGMQNREIMLQRLEIIRQEITALRTLLSNLRLRQEITASAYLAVDLSDSSVLSEKNARQSLPIASITKLMTAVVAAENIDLKSRITLTEEMLRPLGHSPSLYLGLTVSAENLLRAAIIQSTNDAAEALSFFMGREKFISLMNKKAGEIGMQSTTFYDAHGISANNKSSAHDLSKLLAYVYKEHPEILEISRDNDFWLPDKTGRMLKFKNTGGFYPLDTFLGGKTGYTNAARHTAASIFNINGTPTAIIVLHSSNRQADTFAVRRRIMAK